MKSIDFPEANQALAKDQPQYQTLYVHVNYADRANEHIACFELTEEEIVEIIKTKRIFIGQHTFGSGYHPLRMSVTNPFTDPIETDRVPMDENRVSAEAWDKSHFPVEEKLIGLTSLCSNCGRQWAEHHWSTRQCEL